MRFNGPGAAAALFLCGLRGVLRLARAAPWSLLLGSIVAAVLVVDQYISRHVGIYVQIPIANSRGCVVQIESDSGRIVVFFAQPKPLDLLIVDGVDMRQKLRWIYETFTADALKSRGRSAAWGLGPQFGLSPLHGRFPRPCILGYFIAAPPWFLAILALVAAPLLGQIPARLRSRWRRAHGLCGECGYDLRGSSGRCPECGSA